MYQKKSKGYTVSLPVGAVLGGVYAFLWTLICSGILGWLIHSRYIPEESIGYGCMGILLTGSAFGAVMGYRKVRRQRLLSCVCSGAAYLLLLLSMTALFFGGRYSGFGVTAFLILGGSAAAAFLGMEKENRRGKDRRKIRV